MKAHIVDWNALHAIDKADLKAVQTAFEDACAELGISADQSENRAAAMRGVISAYVHGDRDPAALREAAAYNFRQRLAQSSISQFARKP